MVEVEGVEGVVVWSRRTREGGGKKTRKGGHWGVHLFRGGPTTTGGLPSVWEDAAPS